MIIAPNSCELRHRILTELSFEVFMPPVSALQIPPPANWQDFESLCCELWALLWEDLNTQKHGRSGQSQCGVDVYGRSQTSGRWAGIQCKGKNDFDSQVITEKELREESRKATKFSPPLSEFIMATTGKKDTGIEAVARELTDGNRLQGGFIVSVVAWDDIKVLLNPYPELVERYCKVSVSPAMQHEMRTKLDNMAAAINTLIGKDLIGNTIPITRYNFDSTTLEGRQLQFQANAVQAAASMMGDRYPNGSITEGKYPEQNVLTVLLPNDRYYFKVHVIARFDVNAYDVEALAGFIEYKRGGDVFAIHILFVVTGRTSFLHLQEYFRAFPRYGVTIIFAILDGSGRVAESHYIP